MNKFSVFLTFVFSLLILCSCEPDRDENGDLLFGVNNASGNGDGTNGAVKRLKSVTSEDASGEKITFDYIYLLGELVNVSTSDNSVSYSLTYDNNNVNTIEIVQNDGATITTTNFTVTYNNGKFVEAAGIGTEDSGNSFKNTITAGYNNNKVSTILSKMIGIDNDDPTITYEMFSMQSDITYTGNNISTWKLSSIFPATPPITLPPVVITSIFSDYDSKINPFNKLPEAYNIVSSLYGFDSVAVIGFSANNYRKINANGESATYVYTYDAAGYPTKAVASGNLGSLTFEYY